MTVQLNNVQVLDNPAPFTADFKFLITFDCVEPGVKEELEWKLIYVGSADCEDNDQELDSILVGPVRVGKNRFCFEAPAPDPRKIPESDLLDVTVVLLTCSYREQEFIRIGYYVHNEYSEELDPNDDKMTIVPQKITRNILADKPRVTRFGISWDGDEEKANADGGRFGADDEPEDDQENEHKEDDEEEEDEEEEEEEDDDDDDDDDGSVDLEAADLEESDRTNTAKNGKRAKQKALRSADTAENDDQDIDMR